MGLDSCRNIAGKVLIDGCAGVSWQQGNALLDRPARRQGSVQDGNRAGIGLDYDFRTRANTGKQTCEVAGGVVIRYSNSCHGYDDTAIRALVRSVGEGSRPPTHSRWNCEWMGHPLLWWVRWCSTPRLLGGSGRLPKHVDSLPLRKYLVIGFHIYINFAG